MLPVCPLFRSFFQAGFECSTHRNVYGRRLDLLDSTRHDCFAKQDYSAIRELGIRTVRTAARWHLIEKTPEVYDFESLKRFFDCAQDLGIEVILDVLHFGCPEHIDLFSNQFPDQFARFTHALIDFLKTRGIFGPMLAPVNEISFLSWAGGDKAAISPFGINRGHELKRSLLRAAVACSELLLRELPGVRLIAPEPVIHIVGNPDIPGDDEEARLYTLAQFECWDMLCGRLAPELGGRPEYLDIIGVNYYARNEWIHNAGPLSRDDPRWRPFHQILNDVWTRYRRPLFVSETGTEDETRSDWFNYVCDEVSCAISQDIPVHGICLYPILNHPGWDDDRHCHNGLFDYADDLGNREIHQPLAEALLTQQRKFARNPKAGYDDPKHRSDLFFSSPVGVCFPTASAPDEPVCQA